MMILVTGTWNKQQNYNCMSRLHRQAGFTLLEILVVMVLLGIIISVAVLSTSDGKSRQLEQDVQRLVQLVRLAQEEAILNQVELAIKFYPDGYEFQILEGEDWSPIQDSKLFSRRQFDENYELEVLHDGISISLREEDSGRILLLSSGDMTPFELHLGLYYQEPEYVLTGDEMGKITVKNAQGDILSG